MRIVIFGSAGFVGRNLLEAFSKTQYDLVSADLLNLSISGVKHHHTDITNQNDVLQVTRNSDVIIHLAAHPLSRSLDEIHNSMNVNIMGLVNILESARKNEVKKIIFTSASSLIGDSVTGKVKESVNPNPKTPYGVAKLASEHLIKIYKENYGINFTIFRFFNIYGPYQVGGLIPNVYSRLKNDQPVDVFGDGKQLRDYVFVPDIIDFITLCIDKQVGQNKIINMGRGVGNTVLDVIEIASRLLNKEPKIKFHEQRKGEISNFVADTEILKSEFGKIPPTLLQDGIGKTFDWLSTSK